MAARKPKLRRRARELRAAGWALRPIANETGAALSTVSLWVRDILAPVAVPPAPPLPEVGSSENDEGSAEHRRCGKCLRDLPLTSFDRHSTGYQWWCRDCYHAYFRARAEAPPG